MSGVEQQITGGSEMHGDSRKISYSIAALSKLAELKLRVNTSAHRFATLKTGKIHKMLCERHK